jgi:hypothetical protein
MRRELPSGPADDIDGELPREQNTPHLHRYLAT